MAGSIRATAGGPVAVEPLPGRPIAMFNTDILDSEISRTAERLEIERKGILAKVISALRSGAPDLGVREAYVVGSLVHEGEWTDASDVDVAVSGADPLQIMLLVERASGRVVDVIDLDGHPEPGMLRRRGTKIVG